MINDDAQGWTSSDTIAQNERVIRELSSEVASLRAKLETVWTEESLANAIKSRQVILRNVDGGTNIGTITPADAAMLARVALSRPLPKPYEGCKCGNAHCDGHGNYVATPPADAGEVVMGEGVIKPFLGPFGGYCIDPEINSDDYAQFDGQRVQLVVRAARAARGK